MAAYRARVGLLALQKAITDLRQAKEIEHPGEDWHLEFRVYLDDEGNPTYPESELTCTTGHVETGPQLFELERIR